MDDAAFREEYKPVHVPALFNEAKNLQDQVVFALAEIGEGTADMISQKLEELEPDKPEKEVVAEVHEILSALFTKGLIAGHEQDGTLTYNLQKITQANDGKVDPNLLASGLD
jgi:hypothetical protein